jgi:CHAT domain-containing protein/tetratricopeptide (TPR) repeat protein
MTPLRGIFHSRWRWISIIALMLEVLPLSSLRDMRPPRAQAVYARARLLFEHGQLVQSQQDAARGYNQFAVSSPQVASKLLLLRAESMLYRGMSDDALLLLESYQPPSGYPEDKVEQLAIEAVAYIRRQQTSIADQKLAEAGELCSQQDYVACGEVLSARGISAVENGSFDQAQEYFHSTLVFAQAHHDMFLQATAALNLGWTELQVDHYDQAMDWSRMAYKLCNQLGAQDLAERASGNLGWAYLRLGDTDRALSLFLEARKNAARMGNLREELRWLTTAGYTYQDLGNLVRAGDSYQRALAIARRIDSREDIVSTLEVLAYHSISEGKLDEASSYADELVPLVRQSGTRLDDLDLMLARGEIAAARNQDPQAIALFRAVEADPESQTSMRLGAEHQLANLYEREGDDASADRMYRTALTTFESARQQLKKEASKLPFLANATPIYTDYIHFLIQQGKVNQALDVADHGRARTLAQGLGLVANERTFQPAALNVGSIAHKAGATLLFYWLGRSQSYLWAITPTRTALFPLPGRGQLTALVQRYRGELVGPLGTLASLQSDGTGLYELLVAPAATLIPPDSSVVILSDGVLSELNFETLIVPGPHPHYWIEDATISSAPSLYMLAAARPARDAGRKLLLLGNAISQDADYPDLPHAATEMHRIEKHFAVADETVLSRLQANPSAYLDSRLQQYAYIHFVAHGVASLTDPLDSAIILSPDSDTERSFKLYARQIIQRPIHARLVTISSCYGGGTRSYAGEGLVGLSWAFLRAGAHNVIGALWEVSDDSTPQLMDTLYRQLEQGAPPSTALRQAKLQLLHAPGNFHNPFYWAPFQLYTGL